MIVKNEEKNIEKALGWAKDIAFEQIVVDTGSTDRTVELAEKLGAKVYHFEWIDDFGAAKNYAIEQASGNWIALLDADEYFTPEDAKKLMQHLKHIQTNPTLRANVFALNCPWAQVDDSGRIFATYDQERVFRSFLRYVGKIHEQLDMNPENLEKVFDIKIIHTGYTQEAYEQTKKTDRNIDMLRAGLLSKPNDLNLKAYLADSLVIRGIEEDKAEANELFYEVMQGGRDLHPSLQKKAYLHVMGNYANSSDPREASEAESLCRKARNEYPGDIDIEYTLAGVLNKKKEYSEAWEILRGCEEKLINADVIGQSEIVSAKPWVLFVQLMVAAQGIGNVEGVVRYSTMVLKEDNSIRSVLATLVVTLLKHDTSEEDVIGLLAKLYDFTSPKDLLFLARTAKEVGALALARMIADLTKQALVPES